MPLPNAQPSVSVIVEGDNEVHSPGATDGNDSSAPLCLGLRGLLEQEFPLERVDLIMVGSPAQIRRWQRQTEGLPFGQVRFMPAGDVDYYEMKKVGAEMAASSILAFVDSDVKPSPRWLATLVETIESGLDVSAGLTQLEWHGYSKAASPLMLAFGCISWAGILGPVEAQERRALGFHANNVGFRAHLLKVASYRPGLLRACAAHELFRSWTQSGGRVCFRPEQRVVHAFTLEWWADMHARAGMESLLSRRLFPDWPQRWVRHLGPIEPMVTAAWRCMRDPMQWWRYGAAAGLTRTRRIALGPVLIAVSVLTRGVEMFGAYRGMLRGDLHRELSRTGGSNL